MKTILRNSVTALVIASCGAIFPSNAQTAEQKATEVKDKAKAAVSDNDVTYGRIKELTSGQKVVINVDNAPDKTFDLASKDVTVKLGKGLKVGDPVKVEEQEVAGVTKAVAITKHTGGGVTHGDPNPVTK